MKGLHQWSSCNILYLSRHGGNAAQFDCSREDVSAKPRVLWVLQVADAAADSVFVFHIRGLYLLVDMCNRAVKGDLVTVMMLNVILSGVEVTDRSRNP